MYKLLFPAGKRIIALLLACNITAGAMAQVLALPLNKAQLPLVAESTRLDYVEKQRFFMATNERQYIAIDNFEQQIKGYFIAANNALDANDPAAFYQIIFEMNSFALQTLSSPYELARNAALLLLIANTTEGIIDESQKQTLYDYTFNYFTRADVASGVMLYNSIFDFNKREPVSYSGLMALALLNTGLYKGNSKLFNYYKTHPLYHYGSNAPIIKNKDSMVLYPYKEGMTEDEKHVINLLANYISGDSATSLTVTSIFDTVYSMLSKAAFEALVEVYFMQKANNAIFTRLMKNDYFAEDQTQVAVIKHLANYGIYSDGVIFNLALNKYTGTSWLWANIMAGYTQTYANGAVPSNLIKKNLEDIYCLYIAANVKDPQQDRYFKQQVSLAYYNGSRVTEFVMTAGDKSCTIGYPTNLDQNKVAKTWEAAFGREVFALVAFWGVGAALKYTGQVARVFYNSSKVKAINLYTAGRTSAQDISKIKSLSQGLAPLKQQGIKQVALHKKIDVPYYRGSVNDEEVLRRMISTDKTDIRWRRTFNESSQKLNNGKDYLHYKNVVKTQEGRAIAASAEMYPKYDISGGSNAKLVSLNMMDASADKISFIKKQRWYKAPRKLTDVHGYGAFYETLSMRERDAISFFHNQQFGANRVWGGMSPQIKEVFDEAAHSLAFREQFFAKMAKLNEVAQGVKGFPKLEFAGKISRGNINLRNLKLSTEIETVGDDLIQLLGVKPRRGRTGYMQVQGIDSWLSLSRNGRVNITAERGKNTINRLYTELLGCYPKTPCSYVMQENGGFIYGPSKKKFIRMTRHEYSNRKADFHVHLYDLTNPDIQLNYTIGFNVEQALLKNLADKAAAGAVKSAGRVLTDIEISEARKKLFKEMFWDDVVETNKAAGRFVEFAK